MLRFIVDYLIGLGFRVLATDSAPSTVTRPQPRHFPSPLSNRLLGVKSTVLVFTCSVACREVWNQVKKAQHLLMLLCVFSHNGVNVCVLRAKYVQTCPIILLLVCKGAVCNHYQV